MKKLLAIVVLSLLWSNNLLADEKGICVEDQGDGVGLQRVFDINECYYAIASRDSQAYNYFVTNFLTISRQGKKVVPTNYSSIKYSEWHTAQKKFGLGNLKTKKVAKKPETRQVDITFCRSVHTVGKEIEILVEDECDQKKYYEVNYDTFQEHNIKTLGYKQNICYFAPKAKKFSKKAFAAETCEAGNYLSRNSSGGWIASNRRTFDNTAIVKKPETKKQPSKKQVTKAPEIDESLLTIGSGSGFYINNKGYALTNNHVVDICKQMVAVVDGREILFRVLNTDKTNDVAIIKTDQKSPNFIKINEEGAKLGEDIIAVGYPLSGRLSDSVKITRGIVSALSGIDNNSGQIQIDAALQPGNSGGPVINESGELIGIASAGLNKLLMAKEAKYIPENVNFAVSSSIVTNILKNKKVSYSTPSFFSGSYSNTELATLGDKVTLQLFCRNTRTAYNKLKRSKQYSHILIDLD